MEEDGGHGEQAADVHKDIGPILEGWPHEPGQISVRKVRGADGRVKIQLRLDLGLLQMEATGRPDGQRPHGCESMLDYCRQLLKRHTRTHGTEEGFTVDEKLCELLRAEGVQYYYRYLSGFVLEEYEAVARDTIRNLQLLDFCAKYAEDESDRYVMEQYRPYILMMSARARTQIALRDNRPRAARKIAREALEGIRGHYAKFGHEELVEASSEVSSLESLLKDIEKKIPVDPIKRLRRRLDEALREERYEEAARLRDAIRAADGGEEAS